MATAAGGIGMGMQSLGAMVSVTSDVLATDMNANAMQAEARSVEAQAAFDETQQRRVTSLDQGKANAVSAASGIAMGSGSPLIMELDRIKQGEIEALSIKRKGKMEAESLRFGARLQRRSIPWKIAGGILNQGSILSSYAGSGGLGSKAVSGSPGGSSSSSGGSSSMAKG